MLDLFKKRQFHLLYSGFIEALWGKRWGRQGAQSPPQCFYYQDLQSSEASRAPA